MLCYSSRDVIHGDYEKKFIPTIYESKELENIDPWWKFKSAIDDFNEIRMVTICHFILLLTSRANFI